MEKKKLLKTFLIIFLPLSLAADGPSQRAFFSDLKGASGMDISAPLSAVQISRINRDQEMYDLLTEELGYIYSDINTTAVFARNAAIYDSDEENAGVCAYFVKYDTIQLTAESKELGMYQTTYNGKTAYIRMDDVVTSPGEVQALKNATYNHNWYGQVLSPWTGSVSGPSGRETYYDLDMSVCIANMRDMGYYGKYWIRDDGVKMLGDYVMVAAGLSIRPYGSLVPTSLGMGIVVDTGGFALRDPYQLDIAVTW